MGWRLREVVQGVAVLLAASGLFFAGCQTGSGPRLEVGAEPKPEVLAPGDVLKLTFPSATELSQTQKVRADGKMSLPLIGEVTAAGKQLGAFQKELARAYKAHLTNAEIIVTLEASAIPVYVSGAVNRPGRILLERPMTVLEAIMEAGGFASGIANAKRVVLVRVIKGQHTTRMIDLTPALKGRSTGAIYLEPYDVIYVPESVF